MKAFGRIFRLAVILALTVGLWVAVPPVRAIPMIQVTTTEDTVNSNGNCSLREAVQAANTNDLVDTCDGTASDLIGFNIGASGTRSTITLTSMLSITTTVTLDGTTQPGYPGAPLIHIAGNGTGVWISLDTNAHDSVIRGLQFSQPYPGPSRIPALYVDADNIQIKSNHFNTDGTAQVGSNATGIMFGDSSNSTVGGPVVTDRNLFGGPAGIQLSSGTGNMIQGNYFGVQTGGNTMLTSMDSSGIAILISPSGGVPSGNTIRDNVIAKYAYGIALNGATTGTLIYGNHIGVGADGTTALGNARGVYLEGSSGNTIGGTTAADRNVISASTNAANIELTNDISNDSDGNVIQGNYIGTAADGVTGLSPTVAGIKINNGDDTMIGGSLAGAGNVVSGNFNGIVVDAGNTGTLIRGNMVGTDPTGTIAVGNENIGVTLSSTAKLGDAVTPGKNVIGGHTTGSAIAINDVLGVDIYGNWIGISASGSSALPNAVGVNVFDGGSLTVVRNWIASNTQYGVLLAATSTSAPSSQNCFSGNAVAVSNGNTSITAPFDGNWWGNSTGPTHSGNVGGTGDPVSDHVGYYPWLASPALPCQPTLPETVGINGSGTFYLRNANSAGPADNTFGFGWAGPTPLVGDWDGDGVATIGIDDGGWFFLRNANSPGGADLIYQYGWAGATPLMGDWNGDGIDTPGLYSGGWFFLRNSNSPGPADVMFSFGWAGPTPLVGDWNGDGTDTIGIHAGDTFYLRNSNSSGAADITFGFGWAGPVPITGDWDGDGMTTVGLDSNGTFFLRNANSPGPADVVFSYGWAGATPLVGTWDLVP